MSTATADDQLAAAIEAAVAAADLGRPNARKAGRNPAWPYVPVILRTDHAGATRSTQLIGLAYATRAEAVAVAAAHIDRARAALARDLADPRYRALRQQHGLPREVSR